MLDIRLTKLIILTPLAYCGGNIPLLAIQYPIAIHIMILRVGAKAVPGQLRLVDIHLEKAGMVGSPLYIMIPAGENIAAVPS